MEKINPEIEKLNKKIDDLSLFAERQQEVLELYQGRFRNLKSCLFNPFSAIRFLIKYYKRANWAKYKKPLSAEKYTNWIKSIEDTYPVFSGEIPDNYILLKAPGIILNNIAISSILEVIKNNPNIDLIYADEDFIDEQTKKRNTPYFKPDYSPDTLLSFNYIGDFIVLKKGLLSDDEIKDNKIYDIILMATEKTDNIYHIRRILFHKTKEYAPLNQEETTKIQLNAIKRRGLLATLSPAKDVIGNHVLYSVNEPLVSVIIPSKDHFSVLKKCLDSLFSKIDYKNFEVILVDNGSSDSCKKDIEAYISNKPVTFIYEPMEFNFSKMCNIGASKAKGEYLLFLNDDIEIIDGQFLKILVGASNPSHVGAVGAKLLYPKDFIIQHDGIIDIAAAPVHALHFGNDKNVYYFGRNRLDFNVAAVTGAALMVSKEKFNRVLGFNEELSVGFNDIDLCYKLMEAGYMNVLRNDAVLIHHESLSRGNDTKDSTKHKRYLKEKRIFSLSHPGLVINDRFYHPLLTKTNTDYSLKCEDF